MGRWIGSNAIWRKYEMAEEPVPMLPMNPIAFSLCATDHGMMILPTWDYYINPDGTNSVGVGHILRVNSCYDPDMLTIVASVLAKRHELYPNDEGIAIDAGANVGVYTMEMARVMKGWGKVLAFEPQRPVFNCLAGNVAMNNCHNTELSMAAIGDRTGTIFVPEIDFTKPGAYGGLQLKKDKPDCMAWTGRKYSVPLYRIDEIGLNRLDVLKIDIEGMEPEALAGSFQTVRRCRPFVLAEWIICGDAPVRSFLESQDYTIYNGGIMLIGLHKDDPMNEAISVLFNVKEAA